MYEVDGGALTCRYGRGEDAQEACAKEKLKKNGGRVVFVNLVYSQDDDAAFVSYKQRRHQREQFCVNKRMNQSQKEQI